MWRLCEWCLAQSLVAVQLQWVWLALDWATVRWLENASCLLSFRGVLWFISHAIMRQNIIIPSKCQCYPVWLKSKRRSDNSDCPHDIHIPHWWSAEKNCSSNLNAHWFRTILSLRAALCSFDLPNYHIVLYIPQNFAFFSLQYPPKPFQSSWRRSGAFLQNVRTCSHCTVQKPKKKEDHPVINNHAKNLKTYCIRNVLQKWFVDICRSRFTSEWK